VTEASIMVKQKKTAEETVSELEPIAVEKATCEDDVRLVLEEIKKSEGLIGYILRNTTSATIDLNDPTKLIDYATFSSSTFDASEQLSELFELGKIRNIRVEGKDINTLHLSIDENDVSIFMEKTVDTMKILEKMHSQ
jgi:predicted regulator of Ras-like GTPase activity (Roadblock/LC7/MglB family)